MANTSKIELTLKLLSDAIPGNGEGLTGIIDTDICYDEFGLPYIPAKRIKGILRESALDLSHYSMLTNQEYEELFGTSGSKWGTDFRIGNGYLPGYQSLRSFLDTAGRSAKLKNIFTQQSTLQCFTYLRSQTSLEEGIAQKSSLRTKRVLRSKLCFVFQGELLNEHLEALELTCKVTRRFGLNRTRGLGEISLSVALCQDQNSGSEHSILGNTPEGLQKLQLRIKNHGSLISTSEVGKQQVSNSYISGASILGAVASKYIRQRRNETKHYSPDDDDDFIALFSDGRVSWGNAYPSINGKMHNPIPLSWKRNKHGDDIYNLMAKVDSGTAKDKDVTLKGFSGLYHAKLGYAFQYLDAEMQIEYHHKRPQDRTMGSPTEQDGEFFQFEALKSDQQFAAEIIGESKYLKLIEPYLTNTTLYLGKSKTAQYGSCSTSLALDQSSPPELTLEKEDNLYLTLCSDTIIRNANGISVVSLQAMKTDFIRLCKDVLGIELDLEIHEDSCFFASTQIGGYVSIWNMPRPQEYAFKAGSVFTFENKGENPIELTLLNTASLGASTERGYGRFSLAQAPAVSPSLTRASAAGDDTETTPCVLYPVYQQYFLEQIKRKAIDEAKQATLRFTSSELRRVMAAVSSVNDADADKFAKVSDNLAKIKKYKVDGYPAWLKPIVKMLSNSSLDVGIKAILQDISPDENLSTIQNILGITEADRKSYFNYIQIYVQTYLRILALALRKQKLTKAKPKGEHHE